MKIVEINGGVFGSTGRIMFGIADALTGEGHETLCFSPVTTTNRDAEPEHPYNKIGSFRSRRLSVLAERITGLQGCFAYFATKRMLKQITAFSPDIIHLHTLHGGFINLPLLFRYIKKREIKVIWTLHDCWAFTGHCPHFVSAGCDKWKTECSRCPLYHEYPKTLFDTSKKMYRFKRRWFLGVRNMTLVTPSTWLRDRVRESFLSCYPIRVIHNGIDLSEFKPAESDFKKQHDIEEQYMVLGVAFGWNDKKGLDVFCALSSALGDGYRVVLVGTDDAVDRKLPPEVIPIQRTADIKELAGVYSAADVLVNPSREDTFPTVNIEALACGTPVVTFPTGGSPEIIDETCGCVTEQYDVDELQLQIRHICQNRPYSREACVRRAADFESKTKFYEYSRLMKES